MGGTRRNGSVGALLAGAALVAVALFAMAPAFACGPTSTAHISPEAGAPGDSAAVTGTLFKASMGDVVIKWGGAAGVVLATAAVASDGSFGPVPVTIPADAEPGRIAVLAVYQPGDPAAKVSNVAFQVAGTPVEATPIPQPAAESSPSAQPAPAPAAVPAPAQPAAAAAPARTTQAAAATTPAPATTAVPAAVPAPGLVPAPAAEAVAPAAVAALDLPEITETAPAGMAVPAPAADGGPAAAGVAGAARDDGLSPWVLVPLIAVGFTLVAVSIAVVAYEPRRRRARTRS